MACMRFRRSALAALCSALLLHGCPRDDGPAEPGAATGPEEQGTFLNEPSGVPPAPFLPEQLEIQLRAALDPAAAATAVGALTGVGGVSTTDNPTSRAFLQRYAAWYSPIGDLLRYRDAVQADAELPALSGGAPALPLTVPIIRAPFTSPTALLVPEIITLTKTGVRGNLVLWYPLMVVRERLLDGHAGLWRGITRMREELPGGEPRLGGTPVLMAGAVAALDVQLFDGRVPAGFQHIVTRRAWLGPPAEHPERRKLMQEARLATAEPPLTALPEGWQALFKAPDGTPVAYLVPESTAVMDPSFDKVVESLVPVVQQGGKAWLLIALPLAQERKPERF